MVFYYTIMVSFISHRQSSLINTAWHQRNPHERRGTPKFSPEPDTGAETRIECGVEFSAGYE
jgi:hypothetical protein